MPVTASKLSTSSSVENFSDRFIRFSEHMNTELYAPKSGYYTSGIARINSWSTAKVDFSTEANKGYGLAFVLVRSKCRSNNRSIDHNSRLSSRTPPSCTACKDVFNFFNANRIMLFTVPSGMPHFSAMVSCV